MLCYLIYAAMAFFASWLLVGIMAKHATQLGLVDRPNERSLHARVTPRGGGLGIVIVWAVGCVVLWVNGGPHLISGAKLAVYMVAALAIAAISLRDDFCSVGAGVRICVHIGAAIAMIQVFTFYDTLELWNTINLGRAGVLLTIFWVVGLTNGFNFMDGVDGIAGLQAVVAAFAWFMAATITGSQLFSGISGVLAGAAIGFLVHNWSPARIFMGDVGSAFLGFHFAISPLFLRSELVAGDVDWGPRLPLFAMAVVWPFAWDCGFTFVRRLLRGEAVWKPHRSHLYQRMVQAGWRHSAVATYYGCWAMACSLAALHYLRGGSVNAVFVVAVLHAALTFLLVQRIEAKQFRLRA